MGNGLLLFCSLQEGWDLAEDSRCVAKDCAGAKREGPGTHGGDHRSQSVKTTEKGGSGGMMRARRFTVGSGICS